MQSMEVYISLFFVLVGGLIVEQASAMQYYSQYGPGPGLLPLWIGVILTVLSVINLVMTYKKNDTPFSKLLPKGVGLVNLLACVGSFLLFTGLVSFVGFSISSFLMLSILFSRGYKWYWALAMSAAVTGVLFLVFGSVLGVPLPVNEYGW